jgi:DNA polymerase delta subunit 2
MVGETMSVDLLPGSDDPASYILPQRPIHKGMFQSSFSANLSCRTNPCALKVEGSYVFGTSGQNLEDLLRYVPAGNDVTTALDLAEKTLQWRHFAPTAPDTLPCFPYASEDPFIFSQTPHLYFIGNQREFGYRHIEVGGQKGVVVLIPVYSLSRSVVLMNLRTLELKCVVLEGASK